MLMFCIFSLFSSFIRFIVFSSPPRLLARLGSSGGSIWPGLVRPRLYKGFRQVVRSPLYGRRDSSGAPIYRVLRFFAGADARVCASWQGISGR